MKKQILLTLMMLVALIGAAKELKTLRVTTNPPMDCPKCEVKIKNNLRFEKGIKNIAVDLPGQVVTVTFDADKTNEANIVKAFGKINYKVTILGENETPKAVKTTGDQGSSCESGKKK